MINFDEIREALSSNIRTIIADLCPGGRLVGQEWTCGTTTGGKGDSFKFNIRTQKWSDFATGDKGGDIIALYAFQRGIKQLDAAKELAEKYNARLPMLPPEPKELPPELIPAPHDTQLPSEPKASGFWIYKTQQGETAFVVFRFDPPTGKKYFTPMSWNGFSWIKKIWPKNRPLWNLEEVKKFPTKQVLIVEGEKTAVAAKLLQSDVVVVTWAGGAQAVNKTDWTPLRGRKIILWPDNDEAGFKAMQSIADELGPFCEVKHPQSIDADKPSGWDIADAIEEGSTWRELVTYAKPRMKLWTPKEPVIEYNEPPEPPHTVDTVKDEGEDYPSVEVPNKLIKTFEDLGMRVVAGKLTLNEWNIYAALKGANHLKNLFWFDSFHQKVFTTINGTKEIKDSHHITKLLVLMQQMATFEKLKKTTLSEALDMYVKQPENVRNEPQEWLNSLKWDERSRIDTFFIDYMGAEDSEYTRSVSRNFWLSLVARIVRPGCKVDNMVILEGAQGVGKSSAMRLIGGDYYAEVAIDPHKKDFIGSLQGKFLIEIGELASFTKSETEHVKQIISAAVDVYRKPYGSEHLDVKRQSVFVGTTNNSTYLKDDTGNRRFWPIACGDIDLEAITRDREQFFVEALLRVNLGEPWHLVPYDIATTIQTERLEVDDMTNLVEQYLVGKSEVTAFEVWTAKDVFNGLSDFKPVEQKRVAKILKSLKWKRKKVRRGVATPWVWVRDD